ncbi:MAG TPA: stage V sporulation protein D [Halanaerobiales bacterium]|nr:stage V sporulation protein D [Halanaerobiales bacterium]
MANLPHLEIRKRIVLLFFILFIIFLILAFRLSWIQLINSSHYQEKAIEQRRMQVKVEPKRGIIYDRNGNKLAVSASSETVVAIPPEIDMPEETARKLADVLEMDYNLILERLTRDARAVYVKRKLNEEMAAKVRELNLKGITFTEESKRFYPNDNLASHVLGFAGIDSQGLDGLELAYDRYLRGNPGKIEIERDASGRLLPYASEDYIAPQDGYDIYLTIDEVIQYIVERELDRAQMEFSISGGTVIVMEPETGHILAMANRPDYNPNNFADYSQKEWRNRGISDGFEPGSTFKIMTTAAALESGVVNENDVFVDPGYIKVSGEQISCWKAGGHGRQTFAEVVQNSCNPGFVQVGMRLGKEEFYNYIAAFGFGKTTEIRLPGEARGILSDYSRIGPVELATMAFGHGINVTPIQLTAAVAAVANDGLLMRPGLVKEIRSPDGELIEEINPLSIRKVISSETALRTTKLLERVVSDGTGESAYIEGYRVGGKTGTAKHYSAEVYDSSFIGILPVDDPKLVITVVLYDVTGPTYYGSQTAAPIFRNIALDVLRYLEIPPETGYILNEDEPVEYIKIPDVQGLNTYEAEEKLRKSNFDVKLIGKNEKILKQVPLPGAEVLSGTTILLFTEDETELEAAYYIVVPNLIGMNRIEVHDIISELGFSVSFHGEGRVAKQSIQPGERIPGGSKIEVYLQ